MTQKSDFRYSFELIANSLCWHLPPNPLTPFLFMPRFALLSILSAILLIGPSRSFAVTDFSSTGPGQGAADTLDDVWQSTFNGWGLSPGGDEDLDGCSNFVESLAGTDPRNSHDCLMVGNTAISAGNVVMTFAAAAGKKYRILAADSPSPTASWTAQTIAFPTGLPVTTEFVPTADNATQNISVAKNPGSFKFYKLEVQDVDTDGDGVSDWAENKLQTSPSVPNNTGVGYNYNDTLRSMMSLTVSTASTDTAGYEVVDKTAPTTAVKKAKIALVRSWPPSGDPVPAMPINGITLTGGSGTVAIGKSNATPGTDYTTLTINIPAGQGVTGSPYEVDAVTPIKDSLDEVPEYAGITAHLPIPGSPSASGTATVCICDADPTNPDNSQLYVALLGREAGVTSTASGYATALVNGDNTSASVSVTFNNLSSEQNTAYIRSGANNDLAPALPNGQVSAFNYNITYKPGFYSTDQGFLTALAGGGIWCAITSGTYTAGEIAGPFAKANGTTSFDPNRPDLVAPTGTWQNPTGEALEREIWRFLSQSTFGGTQALYDEVLAEVNAAPAGPTQYITGLSNWLDKQMNPALKPSINLRTLVMAEDNEDFLLRGNKPVTYASDPQINGSTYTVTYDAAGNPIIGTTANNNTISNNFPQTGPNRRRAWWPIMLQCKDQVRQRFTQALSEIVIISEADQTTADRHLGCANYWDMIATNAFGKYRNLLENVTYSPMMGVYLSHIANRAAYDAGGGLIVSPDENYAREIMQLFSIGLILRHPDGSLVLNTDGLPIATYDNNDITELARVMTGWSHGARHAIGYQSTWNGGTLAFNNVSAQRVSDLVVLNGSSTNNTWFGRDDGHLFWAAPWINPMRLVGKNTTTIYHDFGAKTLLAGKAGSVIIPAQTVLTGDTDASADTKAATDMRLAHNCLAGDPTSNSAYNGHQNTPVNISRWLIQRLVTSNPSAGYIYRVQKAYQDSNGNLGNVLKAILLDYEARSLDLADSSISSGKVKEPMIAFAAMLRSLKAFTGAPISTLKDNPPPFSGTDSPMSTAYPTTEYDKFDLSQSNPPSLPTGWATGPFRFRFGDTTGNLGQSPQRPPSVFNWFLPDYVLPGPMAEAGLFAPELQISTESSEVAKVNYFNAFTVSNLTGMSTQPGSDSNISDFLLNNSLATPAVRFSLDGGATFVNSLTFTSANYNTPQNVTLVAANTGSFTSLSNSLLRFNITGAGSGYDNIVAPPVDIAVTDNEVRNEGILALHTGFSTWVQEGGKTDTVTVRLASPPPSGTTVTVNVATTSGQVTVSPTSFVFNDTTWNTNQTATVTAVADTTAELPGTGSDTLTFTAAAGSGIYTGLSATVPVGVADNSAAAGTNAFDVLITETGGSTDVTESTATAVAAGIVDSYTIVLTRQPSANVTITCAPNNTQVQLNTTGTTFAPAGGPVTRTFTSANWDTAQTVLVRGLDDSAAEGNHPTNPMQFTTIVHSVGATVDYQATSALQPVVAAIADSDNRIILSHVGNGETRVKEGGSVTDTFTVALRTLPTTNVTVNLGSNAVVCSPANLVFTPANYSSPQTVAVTAVDDFVNEGLQSVGSLPATTAVATLSSGTVSSVNITNSGEGYISPVTVTFTAVGSGATAGTVTRVGNVITAIAVSNGGSGYLNPPTVTISGGGGTGATATAVLNASGGVSSITINNGGSSYTTSPTVAFSTGSGAAGTAVVSTAGLITGVSITNAGSGYVTPPNVTFGAPVNKTNTITASATSAGITDGNYNNYWGNTYSGTFTQLNVTVLDNDAAALVVTPTGGSTVVSEGTVTDDVSFALAQQPTSNVTVTLTPGAQVTTNVTSLTFTPANWNTAQIVTISGVNDTSVEGDALTSVGVLITSSDKAYAGLKAKPIAVTVIDNDLVPLSITHTNVFTGVAEGGTAGTGGTPNVSDTFTVSLPKTPTSSVVVTPIFDSAQITVTPASITFSTTNSGTAQTFTVTAVDDAFAESTPHNAVIRFSVTSTDPFYSNPAHFPVIIPIKDNDSAGFSIVESSGNTNPTESNTDTHTVVLTKQPPVGQTVVIDVASASTADATVSPATLTFTNANWSTAQTVTVTSVADMVTEGREVVNITHTINTTNGSRDTSYDSVLAQTVVNFNADQFRRNENLTIIPSGGSIRSADNVATGGNTYVTEGDPATDGVDFFLSAPPQTPVTVTLSANAQMGFSQSVFYFTPANWNIPQTVQVSAIDDAINDTYAVINGVLTQAAQSQNITFNLSGDPSYNFITATTAVNILDNDSPAVKITQSGGITNTTEGGATDTYDVVLTTVPNGNVVVTATPATGSTINTSTSAINLTFTSANWNVPQTVTVLATNDSTVEGNHQANISHTINAALTTDTSGYRKTLTNCVTAIGSTTVVCDSTVGLAAGMNVIGTGIPANATVASISTSNTTTFTLSAAATAAGSVTLQTTIAGVQTVVNNISDDDNRIIVTPTGVDTRVAEDGSLGDTYSVVLRSAPTANVVITPTRTGTGFNISPATLTFTPANFATPQFFTLTGADNGVNGERLRVTNITHVSASGDNNFNAQTIHTIGVNNISKDDTRVLVLDNPAVTESGTTSTYRIGINREPTANVSITLTSGGQLQLAPPILPGGALLYGSGTTLTFTPANWMNFQTITVRAIDDTTSETPINTGSGYLHTGIITHTITSTDPAYSATPAGNALVTIVDNETPSARITPSGGSTLLVEGGATDTYDIVLTYVPTADVTINITPDAQSSVSPTSVTFNSGNWSTAQTITVTAVNDASVEGTHSTTIAHSACVSTDTNFSGVPVPSVTGSITDNDGAQLVVNQSGGNTTIVEGGANDTIQFSLNNAPTANVTVTLIPPMYIIPVPPYAKQFGYYTTDLGGSNQNRERVVVDYSEIIDLYRSTFYGSLEGMYGVGSIPPVPSDVNVQNAHWAATKAIINKMDLWWCEGSLKARFPDATHIIQPNQTAPTPPPGVTAGLNPRQVILDCIYQMNGGANSLGTTRYSPNLGYDHKNPPTTTFDTDIRDRARNAGYLMTTVMPGFVSH